MPAPIPTPIYRIIHIDNLDVCLRREGLHAPRHTPENGLDYRTIHNINIQQERRVTSIPCGPGGVVQDYVAFYFGYLSPMMLQLKTGQVEGYNEGQEPLIYLVTNAQAVEESATRFVFSDGHGIAAFTQWFDSLDDLDQVDWGMVCQRYWTDNLQDMDRKRRKQAEFLVHRSCDWSLIEEIAVIDSLMEEKVKTIMSDFPPPLRRPIQIRRQWYYH